MSLAFLLANTLLINNISIFCFLYLDIYEPELLRQIFFFVAF